MATIKSFTDLQQSKKLAEILPLESADMYYWHGSHRLIRVNDGKCEDIDIPAWSLAALLSVLPKGIVMNKDSQNGRYHFSFKYIETHVSSDNPVDACYKLILMLHELNLV